MRLFSLIPIFFMAVLPVSAQEVWTITDCIDYALQQNLDLAVQDKTNELYDLGVKQQKMSFGPSVNAQVDYTQAFGRSIDITTNTYRNQNTLSNRYFLSGSLDLFTGLQRWNSLKKSRLEVQSGELSRQIIAENLQLNILTTYLAVLRAREQIDQTELQRATRQAQYERMDALVAAGVMASNELINMKAQLAGDDLAIVNYQTQIDQGLTHLKILLRLDPSAEFEIASPELPDLESMERTLEPLADLYGYAVQQRPGIRRSELAEEVAAYDRKIARSAFLPKLSLFGSVSTNYSDQFQEFETEVDTLPVGFLQSNPTETVLGFVPTSSVTDVKYGQQLNNNLSYAIGLQMTIPIFNKGVNIVAKERAEILAEQAQLYTEQAQQNLYNTLQQAYINAVTAMERFRVAELSLEAAERSLESAENKLESGIGTTLEYNVAGNQRAIAASSLIEAKYDYIFQIKYLDFFRGQPIEF